MRFYIVEGIDPTADTSIPRGRGAKAVEVGIGPSVVRQLTSSRLGCRLLLRFLLGRTGLGLASHGIGVLATAS